MSLVRKISIGKDYKNDAMHYSVGQEVYGGHTIDSIVEERDKFSIYIKKQNEVFNDANELGVNVLDIKEYKKSQEANNVVGDITDYARKYIK